MKLNCLSVCVVRTQRRCPDMMLLERRRESRRTRRICTRTPMRRLPHQKQQQEVRDQLELVDETLVIGHTCSCTQHTQWHLAPSHFKGPYYAKSTFSCPFYINMCIFGKRLWKSQEKRFSLLVLIHLYKSENELIRFWPLYDVITMFCLM